MQFRLGLPLLCASLALGSADKALPIGQSSNDLVEIQASYLDKAQVKAELGADLEGIVVVRMRVRPLSDKPVSISLDDFMLLDTYDGQKSGPYAPSQIAGNSTLAVGSQGTRGGFSGARNGPIWGGLGGGMGGRLPGNGGGVGNTSSSTTEATSTVKSDDKSPPNPMLKVLKEKVLPEKDVTDPISGLLYFQIDGKVKPKDLELYYKTPSGKLSLRFHP
jgi:hypothetical protein